VKRLMLAAACVLLWCASAAFAQTAPDVHLTVTVVDPSGAVVGDASVSVVGTEAATKALTISPLKTTDKGVASFDRLAPGRYSIEATFPGFELGLLKDVRLKAGDNKHVVVLPLKKFSENVSVGRDAQVAAADRSTTFGSTLTREQVDQLSDDADEMAQQLQDLAGPNAKIRVDSFEGAQLPPKAQIKSIHITRNTFAAESHYIGGIFIDIITQPGVGPMRGGASAAFRDGSMSGVNQFTGEKSPEQIRRYGGNLGGSIAKEKASYSVAFNGYSNYDTPNVNVATPGGGNVSQAAPLKTPRDYAGFSGLLDYAVTRDQTMRFSFNQSTNTQRNLGIGAYDLPERGYGTDQTFRGFRMQEAGPIKRRFFINTRLSLQLQDSSSHSVLEAPTIIVNDAFTSGGAQRAGGRHAHSFSLQSDLDYVRGINSWRTGIQLDGGHYRSDDATNYLGTFTFTDIDAYNAGTPAFFTRRIGDPLIEYWNVQAGVYLQDDIRVRKNLTLSPGVRYELQTHLNDYNNFGPRFGVTWAPFKSGRTSVRVGGGVFYDWLSTGTYEQTLRVDGVRQQEINIADPSYPIPGEGGDVRATNKYLLGPDYQMARSAEVTTGIDQTVNPHVRFGLSYNYTRQNGLARGNNLNAPIDGVRPDPTLANDIETVSDAASTAKEFEVNFNFNWLAPSPAASQARVNWRRLNLNGYYTLAHYRNDSDGPFSVPPTGTLATEWGPTPFDRGNQLFVSLNSNAIRNLAVNLSASIYQGTPYNITTGLDDNGDQILNDRPVGVGRNSVRQASQQTWTARVSYTFSFGKTPASTPGGIGITMNGGTISTTTVAAPPNRFRMQVYGYITNLTNHANLTGYSGVMTSLFFLQPTAVSNPRKVDFGISFFF
jgi:Carboxypeptidase regulatory-like domain/TonB dependent receptor